MTTTGTRRTFGPLDDHHPMVKRQTVCGACGIRLAAGDYVRLLPLGPGPNLENQRCAREGEPYSPVQAVLHLACATGFNAKES